eukprot:1960869-Rhodomonas_salina.1
MSQLMTHLVHPSTCAGTTPPFYNHTRLLSTTILSFAVQPSVGPQYHHPSLLSTTTPPFSVQQEALAAETYRHTTRSVGRPGRTHTGGRVAASHTHRTGPDRARSHPPLSPHSLPELNPSRSAPPPLVPCLFACARR